MFARQTGRTTRMLAEARRLAEAGYAVYVIEHSSDQAKSRAKQNPELVAMGVKFESIQWVDFDLKANRLRGSHPNCRVLVDHYVAELELNRLELEASRWRVHACRWDK